MARASLIVCLSLLAVTQVYAATITWTGAAGNGLWNFANNWSPAAVPTASDDVTISVTGGAAVTISQPAAARSIVIGGNNFGQGLVVLSQLAVGSGGVRVLAGGLLSIQTNNALPFTTSGPVNFAAGSTFNFQSGAIYGPGAYTIAAGATLNFNQAALKLIAATNFTNYGTINLPASTIELAESAKFYNYGSINAIGEITFLTADKTATQFVNRGNFTYNGSDNTKALSFLGNTYFYSKLDIQSGRVLIGGPFLSNSSVIFTNTNAALEIQAGPPNQVASFDGPITGTTLLIGGNARFLGSVSVSHGKVSDSGSAAFLADTLFADLTAAGKVTASQLVRATTLVLDGGNLQAIASGAFNVKNLIIKDSPSGNTNNFISAPVTVTGNASIYEDVYVLFGGSANLHIVSGAFFDVRSESSFVKQNGNPVITIDGFLFVEAASGYLSSNVEIRGTGSIRVTAGKFDFPTTRLTIKSLFIDAKAFVNFLDSSVSVGSITGTGGVNISVIPGNNTIGAVETGYLGLVNGPINITNIIAQTVVVSTAALQLQANSSSKTSELYFHGGSITGKNANIVTRILQVGGPQDQILDGVHIVATSFKLITGTTGALLTKNGASITVA